MQDLTGRTALVTGAAGGIGRELVRALLGAGANVMATDVADAGLKQLAEIMKRDAVGQRLGTRHLDISDPRACAETGDATRDRFGTLDILVNNGALGMGVIRDDHMTNLVGIEEIAPEIWDSFVAVNFSGAWYLTRAAVPAMKRAGGGRIVTVTTSFFTMLRGGFHPYGPAKAGLEAMAAGHAKEFEDTGITVNVIVPGGPADTPMVPASSGFRREDLIPPVQMTYPLLWLCSGDADRVTGRRYVAAKWDPAASLEAARAASKAPIGLARAGHCAGVARRHAQVVRRSETMARLAGRLERIWIAQREGAQRLFIIPALQLVEAITAGDFGTDEGIPPTRVLREIILDSVRW